MVPYRIFNIWRNFLFHKRLFVVKEGSSDYKMVRQKLFFKESSTEWFFVEPKMVIIWHRCEEPFKAPLFLRVYRVSLATTQNTLENHIAMPL